MNEFIFVSDFDGTLTRADFYEILVNRYYNDEYQLKNDWIDGKVTVFDFLKQIFSSINVTEEELIENILRIEFDNYFIHFIKEIRNAGGEIIVLSAGSKYYIEKLFEIKGINDVKIYSNPGIYKNGGLHLIPNEKDDFYSRESGIDKYKVVNSLKSQYKKIYYAGDGSPDFKAAKDADIIFARSVLADLCNKNNVKFIPYDSFEDISKYLKQIGVI